MRHWINIFVRISMCQQTRKPLALRVKRVILVKCLGQFIIEASWSAACSRRKCERNRSLAGFERLIIRQLIGSDLRYAFCHLPVQVSERISKLGSIYSGHLPADNRPPEPMIIIAELINERQRHHLVIKTS